ncbi:hypothetical protein FSPOR_11933, partial [Fusarium sporotrichioides]
FYRRRSSTPLGGSRFGVISEKYRNSEENSEVEDAEAGEGQRLGEGSSLVGLSNVGTAAGATRLPTGRGSDRVTVTSYPGPDDDEDGPPPYGGAEDEGVDVKEGYQQLDNGQPVNLAQNWNFGALADSGAEDSTGADIGSDDAQLDSSADERGFSQSDGPDMAMVGDEFMDVDSATSTSHKATLADIENASGDHKAVIDVPTAAGSDRDSSEVAEIHLENEKGTKAE